MSCRERFADDRPLEWTGHQELFAAPPQAPSLPLSGSVRWQRRTAECFVLGAMVELAPVV
jgi:hypothetical protein